MSITTAAHKRADGDDHVGAALRVVSSVHLSLPAPKRYRDALMADFRRLHGLDLSDDDRAAKIRARHS